MVTAAVLADPVCAAILERVPSLGLPDMWLTGGAVFQNVWNALTGRPPGYGIKDYDIFYFDGANCSASAETRVASKVRDVLADQTAAIEVCDQARVHHWYEEAFGVPVEPFTCATDAIDNFAAVACCVGITRDAWGLRLYAPHGLADLFALHLRPNASTAPREVYDAKVATYRARWPSLTSDPWP